MRKRLLTIGLATLMAISITACGGNSKKAAFREFSQKQIQKANKPSIHKRLAAYRAMMPKKTKDKVKNRHQEQSR